MINRIKSNINRQIKTNLDLEDSLEDLWGVWCVHMYSDELRVYLYLEQNKFNYYIPFIYNKLPIKINDNV